MKKTIISLLFLIPLAAFSQQEYMIKGNVSKVKSPAKVYLVYQDKGKMNFDSTLVAPNGSFVIKGTVSIPMKAFVMLAQDGEKMNSRPNPDQVGVYLENGEITINTPDSLFRANVGGTQLNEDQQELIGLLAPFKKTEIQLNADLKKLEAKPEERAQLEQVYQSMAMAKLQIQAGFIESHKNSLVSLNLLRAAFSPDQYLGKSTELFNGLSPELKSTTAAKAYLATLTKVKALTVGNMAPDFTMENTTGQQVRLDSFKGKYVLVDFWASWCGPCRRENPNVVKAYEKFKDKNFTILGISLDGGEHAKEKWMEAIASDGLKWEQLSDLKGWQSEAVKVFHINAVPANFLLDPSGKIIARDLRGNELEEKLSSIL
ncbi:hypothetical protein ASU31_00570 [Pedobacter ginsenosidimutans]|uniref:Thioredoxin domain-containing protein n=1 Tax=Pedobacter ginsenosidimutans TaxID=687842 RepID=A0A0T5VVC5_9SPHI|nr:TlpA disulfide reductase family protein [Pedobacter ginsenosidimutans]KRT17825.1 hypothetical protein ASU31_00570 [Pedobacter ginsenosidimutans]